MKTENIEQKLRDYYQEMKNQPSQTEMSEDIDNNMIARYIEDSASPEEIVKLEKQAESNENLKKLLQTLPIQDLSEEITPHLCKGGVPKGRGSSNFKNRISKILGCHRLRFMTFLGCAACLVIIFTGSFFVIKKINSPSEVPEPQYLFRGISPLTNINQQPTTNKMEKISFQEKN